MVALRDLQAAFWASITAPEGASDVGAEHRWLVEQVHGDARASAAARLDVYANMYFYRLRDNLALDFPALARVLGPQRFHNLITDFLLAHPSRHPSVRQLGRALPTFLSGWTAELAALEWARLEVFDREDDDVLTREDLATAAAHAFQDLRLRAVRAHRLVCARYAIDASWRGSAAAPQQRAQTLLVWRKRDLSVHHRVVSEDERELVDQLAHGLPFARMAEHLSDTLPAEHAAQRALSLVLAWTGDELLRRD